MSKTLILTEKPSVARDIAKALKGCKEKQGYIDCGEYLIAWAFGHLFEKEKKEIILSNHFDSDKVSCLSEFPFEVGRATYGGLHS